MSWFLNLAEKPAKKNGKKNRGGKKDKKAKGGNPQQS